MKFLQRIFFIFIFLLPLLGGQNGAFAQRSKDGAKVVAAANTVVNEYTYLTAPAAAGASTLKVFASALNANARFPGNLAAGDLVMVIQIQGATILGAPDVFTPTIGFPYDSTWGAITAYNNCGNWEFAQVLSVPDAQTINIDCPLINSYTGTGRTEVIRVPRYSSLTVNAGGSITCDPWTGQSGGVCAIEVQNNSTINGSINTSGNGFRGGIIPANVTSWGVMNSASTIAGDGGDKGEGIAGWQGTYTGFGGRYCRSSPANGGGGGNAQNAGGGGGANGGNPAIWNGHGMPDISVGGYVTAWNLEYAGLAAQVSSGGGKGGYSFSGSVKDPTVFGPNSLANWGGDQRRTNGGFGGRPLDYSTGRLFLGGGGGSGNQNDGFGGSGANGGGLIYLMNYGTVSGTGSFISNGNNGSNAPGKDGAGGAGAGGTVIVNSVGAIAGISITTNGGDGGKQVFGFPPNEAEGPGGGGGGGYIGISNGAPVRTANGGVNGTTNSFGVNPKFPPNGATKGGVGTTNGVVTNYVINAANVTICAGQAATLNASLGGNPPGGTTIYWYDSNVGGNVLGTGTSLTTSVIATPGTYTYYVGACPGTYHQPVLVTATAGAVANAGPDATICNGSNTTLNASGGTAYSWTPATGLSSTNISNPVANPVSTTTYVVTVTSSCGNVNDTVIVTVNASGAASISGNLTICNGGQTTLTASGGGNYTWNTGATTAAINVSPTTNTNYTVTVGAGSCTATATASVTVTNGVNASISGPSGVCTGNSATLTASGGNNYSWNTGATTSVITVTPTGTTTYTVTVSNGNCSGTASITITAAGSLTAAITGNTTVCGGNSTTLTASGGTNYVWSNGASTAAISVTPTGATTYSVIVSSGNCSDTATVNLNVSPAMTVNMSSVAINCGSTNGSANATASGGTGAFTYLWNPTGQTNANATGLSAGGNYTVTVSDAVGCAQTKTVNVTAFNAPVATITGNTLLCTGDSTTLNASGGTIYSWNTGATTTSITIIPSVNTTYTVIVSTGNCFDTAFAAVTVSPPPVASIASSTSICLGQSATLTASGGGTYVWNTGATTTSIVVTPTTYSSYSITASIGSCTDTSSASVTVLPVPTANVAATSTLICGGDITTITASGGNTYSWNNGATTTVISVSPAVTTTYTVTASNGTCTDTATIKITVLPPPVAAITGNPNLCQGFTGTLTASGGGTYLWSNGATTSSINPTTPGTYSVLVSVGSCTATATTNVTVNPNPTAGVSPDILIIQGQSTDLTASGGTNYVWSNGANGATITVSPQSTTNYCVTVHDANNCTDTACVKVTVELCSQAGPLYLPNAFSPNGDNANDSLQIYYGIPQCIKSFHLVIYNRWGEKIYDTTSLKIGWDGRNKKGKQVPDGIYYYVVDAVLNSNADFSKTGFVTLIR